MSEEKKRGVICPMCGTTMEYEDYDCNDDIHLDFKCPKCNFSLTIDLDFDQQIDLILKGLGYSEKEVVTEGGGKYEASS